MRLMKSIAVEDERTSGTKFSDKHRMGKRKAARRTRNGMWRWASASLGKRAPKINIGAPYYLIKITED